MDSARARKVLMGTCGWSDHTLLRCGKFYPANVKSAEDRLRHYSSHFPCVEVDTSTYAIPSPANVTRWVNAVMPGFLFHFKVFGLFCSLSGAVSTIPGRVRSKFLLPDDQQVKLYDLPTEIRNEIWGVFNSALLPAHQAGRLGAVIFQFHLSFKPSDEHRAHVMWCRKNLDSRYPMAVEFRSREWFVDEEKAKTEAWLASSGLVLIAADELHHETYQRDREQTGLPPGQPLVVLPVAWPSVHQNFLYIRVHRREGNQRLLSDEELKTWETRLVSQLPPDFTGPIYFMWGTDWEDQPLINAKRLAQRLPKELVLDWKSMQKSNSNSLESMFSKVKSSSNSQPPLEKKQQTTQEDSDCSPPTVKLNQEAPTGGVRSVNISSAKPEEQASAKCLASSAENNAGNIQRPFSTPLSASELSSSQERKILNVGVDAPGKKMDSISHDQPTSRKRDALSNSPATEPEMEGEVVEPSKSTASKARGRSPVEQRFKGSHPAPSPVPAPAKKSRQASGSCPPITSFFKRVTPNNNA